MNEHRIDRITKNDFVIYTNGIPRNVKWNDVKSIEFTSKESLTALLKDNSIILILPNCIGRLEFIKKVPKGIDKFDYSYVDSFFTSLKPCKVCGLYSIDNDTCLSCDYSEDYKNENKGNDSLEAFYKEEQLDYFTTYFDNDESVADTLRKAKQSDIFEVDSKWRIYPTEEEILKARKEITEC